MSKAGKGVVIRETGRVAIGADGKVVLFDNSGNACDCCSGDVWCTGVCNCLYFDCGEVDVIVPQCVTAAFTTQWQTTEFTLKLRVAELRAVLATEESAS